MLRNRVYLFLLQQLGVSNLGVLNFYSNWESSEPRAASDIQLPSLPDAHSAKGSTSSQQSTGMPRSSRYLASSLLPRPATEQRAS
jgi:hypothetical protein